MDETALGKLFYQESYHTWGGKFAVTEYDIVPGTVELRGEHTPLPMIYCQARKACRYPGDAFVLMGFPCRSVIGIT